MREQLSLLPRRLCFFCRPEAGQPKRYLREPHDGPCGRACFGGVTDAELHAVQDLDAFVAECHVAAYDGPPCPHCEVRNA